MDSTAVSIPKPRAVAEVDGLPARLSPDELAELFEGKTRFVDRLARENNPLVRARTLVYELPYDEQVEVLSAHPAISQRAGLSAAATAEHGPSADDDPEVVNELGRLEQEYSSRHGFSFVVFVNRRPKVEILDVLRQRLDNATDDERVTGLRELVEIAEDRWRRR
jgi:2-oxo-4-hydroxy-4-carboxy--5-ureidoimidazoline (OHCU) decarboxylase